ncbi:hypothetical protein HMI54_013903 [Coelomomyces lativittatus]|nr:hypothetical protein HMI54_013903 [Coelomomyces lativittatus]
MDDNPEKWVHKVTCAGCGKQPIIGFRYKCCNCMDYDLCEKCEGTVKHFPSHVFLKVTRPLPPKKKETPKILSIPPKTEDNTNASDNKNPDNNNTSPSDTPATDNNNTIEGEANGNNNNNNNTPRLLISKTIR